MNMIKDWYQGLPKREQYILIVGLVVVLAYSVYVLAYQTLVKDRQRYQALNANAQETLTWVKQTVQDIEQLRGKSPSANAQMANASLAQVIEKAASRAGIRVNRLSPTGDSEAQVWFERVEFEQFLVCLSALELDYLLQVESLSVNASNVPGLVNARIKVSR